MVKRRRRGTICSPLLQVMEERPSRPKYSSPLCVQYVDSLVLDRCDCKTQTLSMRHQFCISRICSIICMLIA